MADTTSGLLSLIAVIAAGVLFARVYGDDITAPAKPITRDVRYSFDFIPNPDNQYIDPDTENIKSGGGFGGGYKSRIESAVKGDWVGL